MERSFSRCHRVVLLSALVTFSVQCVTAATSDSRENEIESDEMCGRTENVEEGDGVLTNPGEFPWSVVILRLTELGGMQKYVLICGGTLVSRDKVLTVAQCVQQVPTANLSVLIGVWHLRDRNTVSKQVLGVDNASIHTGYKLGSKEHNLALLTLENNVDESVTRVCLAASTQQYESNHNCYTVGWSASFINGTNQLLRLKTILLSDRTECQRDLQRFWHRKYQLLPEALCTRAEDTMDDDYPCSRIIGSALVCTKGTRDDPYYLVGVASQLPRNCSHSAVPPDVFMDLRKYTGWISPLIKE